MGDFQDSQQISKRPNRFILTPQLTLLRSKDQLKPLPTHEKCFEYLIMNLIRFPFYLFWLNSSLNSSKGWLRVVCLKLSHLKRMIATPSLTRFAIFIFITNVACWPIKKMLLAGKQCSILTLSCRKSASMRKEWKCIWCLEKLHQDGIRRWCHLWCIYNLDWEVKSGLMFKQRKWCLEIAPSWPHLWCIYNWD